MEELKKERDRLYYKWENAKRKLKRQIDRDSPVPDSLDRAKTDMIEKWEQLFDQHCQYMSNNPKDHEEEETKYATLANEHDDILEASEIKRTEKKKEKKNEENTPEDPLAVRNDTEALAKRNDFQSQLGSIVVSREAQKKYLEDLKENEIENWSETSQCKVIYGIDPEFYEKTFLGKGGLFQRASGVDDETMEFFEVLIGAAGISDQLKTFNCKPQKSGNKIGGKFGMYAAYRRSDGTNAIDVAYTVYNFEADLMGNGELKEQWMNNEVKDSMGTDSLVTRLKVGDISAFTENFIVSKALTAFAQSNVIPRVKWLEDEENEQTPVKSDANE